ncbi:MAG: glycoside hydrolase family 20 zincin-like fold domain-containing protein [Chryseolinea sp.]
MTPTRSLFLLFYFLVFNVSAQTTDFASHFRLLPQPQKVEVQSGRGLLYSELKGIVLQDVATRPVMTGALNDLPIVSQVGKGTVLLKINHSLQNPSPEGYELVIADGQVSITAKEAVGVFYGIQTLRQLLEDSQEQDIEIPACKITDYPEIAYRSIHLDLKHHIDAGRYYYDMIDRYAGIKINAIIIEFEDKLRYRKSSIVASPNAISIEEFAALCNYANDRHIEISPLVQGLGHASFILKHEEYKKLRDDPTSDWVFDPLNPETYALQFSLYEDAIAATPYGKYLHVGGDEVGSLGKSALAKASGKKPIELQMYWLKKVTDFALEHHRIPIFWDDMVFKLANLYETTYDPLIPAAEVAQRWQKNTPILNEVLPLFPKKCVYMRWNYDDPAVPGNINAIDWYKANNLHVMAATSGQYYATVFPHTKSKFRPIKEFCQLTTEKKMDGILCTIWDDASQHLETITRGAFDFALLSWNYEDVAIEKAHEIYKQRFFGYALSGPAFNFEDEMEETTTPYWETAFLKEGDRENFHPTFTLIELPNSRNKGVWSKTNSEKVSRAKVIRGKQGELDQQLQKALDLTRRNRYALSLYKVINELETYSSDMMILLDKYDRATRKDEATLMTQIQQKVKEFTVLRENLEKTYAKTRVMGNPEGYQLDSNFHHHLANGTNSTDWMFLYEIGMNKKIEDWVSLNTATR